MVTDISDRAPEVAQNVGVFETINTSKDELGLRNFESGKEFFEFVFE